MARGAQKKEVKNLGRVTPFLKRAIPSIFNFFRNYKGFKNYFCQFLHFSEIREHGGIVQEE